MGLKIGLFVRKLLLVGQLERSPVGRFAFEKHRKGPIPKVEFIQGAQFCFRLNRRVDQDRVGFRWRRKVPALTARASTLKRFVDASIFGGFCLF